MMGWLSRRLIDIDGISPLKEKLPMHHWEFSDLAKRIGLELGSFQAKYADMSNQNFTHYEIEVMGHLLYQKFLFIKHYEDILEKRNGAPKLFP